MNSVDEFLGIFITEAKEELEGVTNLILEIPSKDSIKDLMRLLHTLKGNSKMLDLTDFSDASHILEDCVIAIDKGKLLGKEREVEFLLQGVDILNNAIISLEKKTTVKIPLKKLTEQFDNLKKSPKKASIMTTKIAEPLPDYNTINVTAENMDQLIRLSSQLQTKVSSIKITKANELLFKRNLREMELLLKQLNSTLLSARMYPLEKIFLRYPRMVRELATEQNKEIKFVVDSSKIELDRTVIDVLNDPLVHILRNAIDHGIEKKGIRKAAKKVERATIKISAEKYRDSVVIKIEDDGAGIDQEKVIQKAIEKGLIKKGSKLNEEDIFNLILHTGLSTKDKPSKISGRGIGMDIVYSNIKKVGGNVKISSKKGFGTIIELKLPLTLAIMNSIIILVGTHKFAFPLLRVSKIINYNEKIIKDYQYFPINKLLETQGEVNKLIIYEFENRHVALGITDVLYRKSILVNKPSKRLSSLPGIGGTTVLSSGKICPVLDLDPLLKRGEQIEKSN